MSFFIEPREELIGVFMLQHWMELGYGDEFKSLVYQSLVN